MQISEETHKKYMEIALALAKNGEGRVEPNPMVGAIVVREGEVVGRGFHEYFGGPHAEVNAINEAGDRAHGSTLYVTLEPCDHFGKTPPCTDLIISSGIKQVVVTCKDPNPIVNGKGVQKLKAAGIEVVEGILEEQSIHLNAAFFKNNRAGMPFYIAKWAMTLDGRIAASSGDSKWITSPEARLHARKMRFKAGAVMVGIGTILADNPQLLGPADRKENPKRIIVDTHARIPLESEVIKTLKYAPATFIAAGQNCDEEKLKKLYELGCKIIQVDEKDSRVDFTSLSRKLLEQGVGKIMIEGGGELLTTAFTERLVDRVSVFIGPKLIMDGAALSPLSGAPVGKMADAVTVENITVESIKTDTVISGDVVYKN